MHRINRAYRVQRIYRVHRSRFSGSIFQACLIVFVEGFCGFFKGVLIGCAYVGFYRAPGLGAEIARPRAGKGLGFRVKGFGLGFRATF